MKREGTFALHTGFPVLARVPLLPNDPDSGAARTLSGSLLEAVRFSSRSLATVTDDDLDADERLAATVHAYERRARTRATPRGAFAGVQVAAQATTRDALFRVGKNHRARTTPSAAWLTAPWLGGRRSGTFLLWKLDSLASALSTPNNRMRRGLST